MIRYIFLFLSVWGTLPLFAQYAPQAGLPGSTAIHRDSSLIVNWAQAGWYHPGWMNIADQSLGKLNGSILAALGPSNYDVLSLGDGGEVVYFFENPIVDGPGYDFAVFENGFRNPLDSNYAFLELAMVEVSSDSFYWARFPAHCTVDTTQQIPAAGIYTDARKINNLAGKYIASYGTPFDLYALSHHSGLQLDQIRYVRIRDVIGTLDSELGTRDTANGLINDPFPTAFITSGFDLDALGIIHQKFPTSTEETPHNCTWKIYPNPVEVELYLSTTANDVEEIQLLTLDGKCIQTITGKVGAITVSHFPSGLYLIRFQSRNKIPITKIWMKR
jgi:hypothetical protein